MDFFRVLINKRPSKICLIDQNREEVHNLQSPNGKNTGATIRIGREIWCLPYAGFLYWKTKLLTQNPPKNSNLKKSTKNFFYCTPETQNLSMDVDSSTDTKEEKRK